jgi:hypothetical protein
MLISLHPFETKGRTEAMAKEERDDVIQDTRGLPDIVKRRAVLDAIMDWSKTHGGFYCCPLQCLFTRRDKPEGMMAMQPEEMTEAIRYNENLVRMQIWYYEILYYVNDLAWKIAEWTIEETNRAKR